MSRIGDKFDVEPPTPGDTSPREWAAEVNEILQELVDRTEAKLEPAHIELVQNLVMNGNDLTEAAGVNFQPRPLSGAPNDSVFYASDDSEIYFKDGAGNAVPLTANGLTNVSSTGIISGDAADASIRYNDSTQTFGFIHRADGNYGYIRMRELELAEPDEVSFATLDYVGGAANRTYTLPGSFPASSALMTMTAGGVISDHDANTPPTLTTTSTVTATTAVYTTERWRVVPIRSANTLSISGWAQTAASGLGTDVGYIGNSASTGWALIDINEYLDDGDIITDWNFPFYKVTGPAASHTFRGSICAVDESGSISVPGSLAQTTAVSTSGGAGYYEVTYTGVSTVTVDRNGSGSTSDISRKYYFMVEKTVSGGSMNMQIRYIMLKVKRG